MEHVCARRMLLLLLSNANAAAAADACDINCPMAVVRSTANGTDDAFTCFSAPDEEQCACAAMRMGWMNAAKAVLTRRMLQKLPSPRVRFLAQTQHDSAVSLLARLHPRYPQHVKAIPALLWSQTDDMVQVRVRFARYPGGEALVQTLEELRVEVSDRQLSLTGEGVERPFFLRESLKWRQALARRDGELCGDRDENCVELATAGLCSSVGGGADALATRAPMARMQWLLLGVYIRAVSSSR